MATRARELVEQLGGCYSKSLDIDLASGKPAEIYKWFIAAALFGARISEAIAIRTYREFEQAGLLSPRGMLEAGWDRLVGILDCGGYARYDFKTATKLLAVNRMLMQQYLGDLNRPHDCAKDSSDLEQRIRNLGKGIGEVTVNIFLRELRGIWRKAAPVPSPLVREAAVALGMAPAKMQHASDLLAALMAAWKAEGRRAGEFPDFEAALVRYGKALRKTRRAPGRRAAGMAPAQAGK